MTVPKVVLPNIGAGLGVVGPLAGPGTISGGSAVDDQFVMAPVAGNNSVPGGSSAPQTPAAPALWRTGESLTIGRQNPDPQKYPIHIPPYLVEVVDSAEGQMVDWGIKYLKALEVHGTTTGEKACVFILDTAGKYDHPDLAANLLPEHSKNFSDADNMDDNHGHGTHVGGIAAANNNDFGVIGVAPGARLVPVKVLNDSGSGSWEGVAAGIRYVADLENFPFKKIISLSLGGSGGSPVLKEAIQYAISKGVFIVAAAGNSSYKEGKDSVDYPGAYLEVITVASIGPDGNPSSFSSGGPAVDVAAPGEKVYSTHKGKGYVRMSGTSMATPHVAGLLALILSAHENIKTQADLEKFLKERAQDIFKPGRDDQTGNGAPIATLYINGQAVVIQL